MKQAVVSIMQPGMEFLPAKGEPHDQVIPNSSTTWAFAEKDDALAYLEYLYIQNVRAVLTIEPIIFEMYIEVRGGVVTETALFCGNAVLPFTLTVRDLDGDTQE